MGKKMPNPPIDPEAFRAFEHEGWERIPERYHNAFASLTSQMTTPLLDAVGVRSGVQLLGVAAGPGYAAAAAAKRGAKVVGVDFAPAMVAEARRRHPAVDFREGDAEDLPFPEASFDAVTMNFGLLHWPDLNGRLRRRTVCSAQKEGSGLRCGRGRRRQSDSKWCCGRSRSTESWIYNFRKVPTSSGLAIRRNAIGLYRAPVSLLPP